LNGQDFGPPGIGPTHTQKGLSRHHKGGAFPLPTHRKDLPAHRVFAAVGDEQSAVLRYHVRPGDPHVGTTPGLIPDKVAPVPPAASAPTASTTTTLVISENDPHLI